MPLIMRAEGLRRISQNVFGAWITHPGSCGGPFRRWMSRTRPSPGPSGARMGSRRRRDGVPVGLKNERLVWEG